MDLSRIFTIGGKPGLQKLVAQSKNGVIVESLIDKKRFNASATSKISSLEDISVFCMDEDKPLKDIFVAIGDKNKYATVDIPSNNELIEALKNYIPNLDDDRVYASDVKKIFKWYNLLINVGTLKVEEKKKEAAKKEAKSEEKTEKKKPATKKKASEEKAPAKKKAAAKPAAKKKTATKKKED